MTHHFFPRLIFGIVLAVAAMTGACDKSPAGPTAAPSPSVPTMAVGAVLPNLGSTDGVEEIRVSGAGFLSGATLALGGVAATVTSVTSAFITVTTAPHAPGPVDVVVTNPGGVSATLRAGYTFAVITLTADPRLVVAGDRLALSWVGPSGRSCSGGGDWIAIYPLGAPDITGAANGHSNLWYDHLCGATSGTSTATAPTQPGQYEFRFMIGDTSVARSSPVTVSAAASPSTPAARAHEK
jgi:hypothetical protein